MCIFYNEWFDKYFFKVQTSGKHDVSYADPSTWGDDYPLCNGENQSPIDIMTNEVINKGKIHKCSVNVIEDPLSMTIVNDGLNGNYFRLLIQKIEWLKVYFGVQQLLSEENSSTSLPLGLLTSNSRSSMSFFNGVRMISMAVTTQLTDPGKYKISSSNCFVQLAQVIVCRCRFAGEMVLHYEAGDLQVNQPNRVLVSYLLQVMRNQHNKSSFTFLSESVLSGWKFREKCIGNNSKISWRRGKCWHWNGHCLQRNFSSLCIAFIPWRILCLHRIHFSSALRWE